MKLFTNRKVKGQGLVEYGLVLALISVLSVGTLTATGNSIKDVYCDVSSSLTGGGNCSTAFFFDAFNDDLSVWDVVRGSWEIIDGKLHTRAHGEGQIFTDINQSDYQVELEDVNLASGKGFGLIFRAEDTEAFNGYTFQYDPGYGAGAFIFRKWANGREFSPFARTFAPDFDWYDTDHDVKVVVNGGQYSAYIDNELVCEGVDTSWEDNTKSVGLRVWSNSDVTFESFTVNPIQD